MEDMKLNCPNCGAPITGDICPYCNTHIEINGGNDSFESYETIECKEANISLWTVAFPMIFGVSFGIMGPMFAIITLTEGEFLIWVFMMGLLFGLIGLGAWVVALTPIVRYIQVKSHGRDVEGTVMGYSNDNVYLRLSNNLYNDTTDDYELLRTKKAVAVVNSIDKVETCRKEKGFANIIKGLNVYGAKVVRPEELYVIRAH